MFYEPDFLKKNLFSSLNSLIFSSTEPQTIDFQHKINFKDALRILILLIIGRNSKRFNEGK